MEIGAAEQFFDTLFESSGDYVNVDRGLQAACVAQAVSREE